mgnify:CR=1 FL=1|tara:strand:- start:45 stop:332 length:288 start_codon:yes stop_codon:yes gene_type:complete
MKFTPISSDHDHERNPLHFRIVKTRVPYRKKITDSVTIDYSLFHCYGYTFDEAGKYLLGYFIDPINTETGRIVSELMELHVDGIKATLNSPPIIP